MRKFHGTPRIPGVIFQNSPGAFGAGLSKFTTTRSRRAVDAQSTRSVEAGRNRLPPPLGFGKNPGTGAKENGESAAPQAPLWAPLRKLFARETLCPNTLEEKRRRRDNLRNSAHKREKLRQGRGIEFKKAQNNDESVLKVVQLNCNRISGPMIEWVRTGLKEQQPHVLVLLETKLKEGERTPRFPGYATHRVDRTTGESGGGIMMLVSEGVQWSALKGPLVPESLPGVEAAGVRLYPHRAKPVDVLGVYNRPELCRKFDPSWIGSRALVCADLNLHHRSWDGTCSDSTVHGDKAATQRLLDWVERKGRKIINDGRPTYMQGSKKGSQSARVLTTPDVTITPTGGGEARWSEVQDWGSDHKAITTEYRAGGRLRRGAPAHGPPPRRERGRAEQNID
eukprot:gene23703-biopygen22331